MPLTDEQAAEIEEQRASNAATRRPIAPGLEEILYRPFKVLDHGFIRVIDYMGNDEAIVQAARVSYGKGTKRTSSDEGLIRYLLRHRHTTPFEMCEIKFHVKLPIFVARQWIRHRTANVNEYSARYSRLDREFYIPDPNHLQEIRENRSKRRHENTKNMEDLFDDKKISDDYSELAPQSSSNKQGREGELPETDAKAALSRIDWLSTTSYGVYKNLLNENGIAREIARIVLPVNCYTQFYWKIDLHNLMHFLSLRADAHAQYEIRAYAEAMMATVERWVPLAHRSFVDNRLEGAEFSAAQLAVLRRMLAGEAVTKDTSGLSGRVWRELMAVLGPRS